MKPPYDDLSRLFSGELSDIDAAALRLRIETEPDMAAAWFTLQGLAKDLGEVDETPPPALDRQVLGSMGQPAPRSWRQPAAVAVVVLALAASTLWFLSASTPPSTFAVIEGASVVSGAASLRAGDRTIEVDGVVVISVEPPPGAGRVPDQKETPMKKQTAMAALGGGVAGAAVTVLVMQGTATVSGPQGIPVVLHAGEQQKFASAPRDPVLTDPTSKPADRMAALEAENEALRSKLAEAQFTGAVARGQVMATQGTPSVWPADLPERFQPAGFEAMLREQLAKVPGFELHELDCDEFPCIATVVAPGMQGDWQLKAQGVADGIRTAVGEDAGLWLGMTGFETEEGVTAGLTVAATPPDAMKDDAVRTRLDFRGQNAIKELEADAPEHGAHSVDAEALMGVVGKP